LLRLTGLARTRRIHGIDYHHRPLVGLHLTPSVAIPHSQKVRDSFLATAFNPSIGLQSISGTFTLVRGKEVILESHWIRRTVPIWKSSRVDGVRQLLFTKA